MLQAHIVVDAAPEQVYPVSVKQLVSEQPDLMPISVSQEGIPPKLLAHVHIDDEAPPEQTYAVSVTQGIRAHPDLDPFAVLHVAVPP